MAASTSGVNKLRVLHVIPSVAPKRGGPSRAVVDMVGALNATGNVDARVLTTNDDGAGRLAVMCDGWTDWGGVPVWFLNRYSPALSPVREFAYAAGLRDWLAQHAHAFDLLHVHALFSYLPSVAMAYARRHRLPYVVRPIGQLDRWSLAQSRLKKSAYLALIERRNLKGAACIHFTSELERDEARCLELPVPVEIIPLGVPSADVATSKTDQQVVPGDARGTLMRRFGVPSEAALTLFLGRLHKKKGLEYLFEAMATPGRPVHLLVAGTGAPAYEASLRALAKTLGIEHCVHWLGFVDGEDKQQLLAGADLFALTSHSENFGIAVIEALAAGAPVLVTRGVALAEFVKKHRLGTVCGHGAAEIAKALRNASPPSPEARASRRGATLQEFGWPRIASRLLATYRRLCE